MLTVMPPHIARIRGTDRLDAFEKPGEPIAVRYLCEGGIESALGRTLDHLKPTRVSVTLTLDEN